MKTIWIFLLFATFYGATTAQENQVQNTADCQIIRVVEMPLTKKPNVPSEQKIALLNTCLKDKIPQQRPVIEVIRNGKKEFREFEIIKLFATRAEAEKYAKENKLVDVNYDETAKNQADYIFFDGSRNKYVITENSLEYIPIKPEESSSGTYSGGEYVKKNLTEDEYKSIDKLLNKAIMDKENQTDEMAKGNPIIKFEDKSYILKMNSELAKQVSGLLKNIKDAK